MAPRNPIQSCDSMGRGEWEYNCTSAETRSWHAEHMRSQQSTSTSRWPNKRQTQNNSVFNHNIFTLWFGLLKVLFWFSWRDHHVFSVNGRQSRNENSGLVKLKEPLVLMERMRGMTGLIHGPNPQSRGREHLISLAFLNFQTILEEEHVWCDTILTEVKETNDAIWVNGLTNEKLKVLDVA